MIKLKHIKDNRLAQGYTASKWWPGIWTQDLYCWLFSNLYLKIKSVVDKKHPKRKLSNGQEVEATKNEKEKIVKKNGKSEQKESQDSMSRGVDFFQSREESSTLNSAER